MMMFVLSFYCFLMLVFSYIYPCVGFTDVSLVAVSAWDVADFSSAFPILFVVLCTMGFRYGLLFFSTGSECLLNVVVVGISVLG